MARPSFIYHQIASLVNIIATVIGTYWLITTYRTINTYNLYILFVLLSVSWGICAHLHFMEEVHYDFNPLIGRYTIGDEPVKREVITYKNYRFA